MAESHRRRGLARAMMALLAETAKDAGCFEMWVGTEVSNMPTRRTYLSAGGAEDEEHLVEEGGVLLDHTSFRAVRPVEGGPAGLIAALKDAIGPRGTLVMPCWTGDDSTPFDPAETQASEDLGVVAETFRTLPGTVRSAHAFAFAASGPKAAEIVAGSLPLPPHIPESPIGRVHDLDGQVLLLGVGHDANTALHLAELMAGVPYGVPKHITINESCRPVRVDYRENDHCCERFALADGWLRSRGLQREGKVGNATSRLFRIRDAVALATAELARDPLIFLHPESAGCGDCDAARASIATGAIDVD